MPNQTQNLQKMSIPGQTAVLRESRGQRDNLGLQRHERINLNQTRLLEI